MANTILLLAILALHPGILPLLAVAIPTGVAGLVLPLALVLRMGIRPHPRVSADLIPLIGRALPFAVLAGSSILYDRVDVLLLSKLAGNSAVGVYSAADRVIDGLLVIPASIGAALYPSLSAVPGQARRVLYSAFRWALPISVGVMVLALFPGGLSVNILYGQQYTGAETTFQLLSPLVPLGTCTVSLAYLLQARVRTGLAVVSTLAGLAVDVVSNLILIPRFSYRGAAISADIAELVALVCLAAFAYSNQTVPSGADAG